MREKEREPEREGKAQQSRKNRNKKKELESQFVGDYFSFVHFIFYPIMAWSRPIRWTKMDLH